MSTTREAEEFYRLVERRRDVRAEFTGDPVDDDTLRITGDLTVKDVTRPITVDFEYAGSAQDPFGNTRVGFEGQTTINRKDFGLNFNAGLETGGVLVSEKIALNFDISAIKQ